jgi:carbohydrate-selective porin OprB
MGFYTLDWFSKWTVYTTAHGDEAGWITSQVKVLEGIGSARTQTVPKAMGSLVNPASLWTGRNGVEVPEMAWQQSLAQGRVVAVAGVINQSNYLDLNTYANTARGQFLNSAFVNSMVVPLPGYAPSVNLQWQPSQQFYLLMGAGSNLQIPKTDLVLSLGTDNWSYLLELGLVTTNTFGLGPGIYRVQPFLATVLGDTQGGVGLNFQQDLGLRTPVAAFGRLGVCGNQIALENIRAQGSLGLALTGPIDAPGPIPLFSNDLLGLAFVWSQAVPDGSPVNRMNEYSVELFYSIQITPTLKLQPDLQVFWDAADRPQSGISLLWQLQLTLTW